MASNNVSRNLVIISVDALNTQDFEYVSNLPHFKSFLEEGSYIREVASIYPTLTYPCHTSIITGTYPNRHGIYSNEIYTPEHPMAQPWYWYEKDIKVPNLFDYAKKANMKTANVLWPVMAGAPIDYNCPEIWSVTGKKFIPLFLKYGTKSLLLLLMKYISLFKGKQQPYLDNFSEAIAKDLIIHKKPNLIGIHFTELDHVRHVMGLHESSTKEILNRMDERIGNIIEATKKANIYDQTTFVVLGDHGTNDFEKLIHINTVFYNEGLITLNNSHNLSSWKAYCSSCGGSAQIHIHPDCSNEEKRRVSDIIGKLSVMPDTYIKQLYTKDDVKHLYHLDGDFEYVLEAKDGYIFRNAIEDTVIKHRATIPNCYQSEHGYLPTHPNLRTMLMAKGASIKSGIAINQACLVDEGPTFAKILGLEMENVDGRVLEELLK